MREVKTTDLKVGDIFLRENGAVFLIVSPYFYRGESEPTPGWWNIRGLNTAAITDLSMGSYLAGAPSTWKEDVLEDEEAKMWLLKS